MILKDINILILAGGLGTRLQAVVPETPKVIAEVCGRPFIFFLFDFLKEQGSTQVSLLVAHRSEQIKQVCGGQYQGLSINYFEEESPMGTGGAVIKAAQSLASSSHSQEILVLNGDSLCVCELNEFVSWSRQRKAAGSIVLHEVKTCERYGKVELSPSGLISSFDEKNHKGPGLISAGVYYFQLPALRQFMSQLNTTPKPTISLEKEIFPELLKNQQLHGYPGRISYFIDMGTPESYKQAQEELHQFANNLPIRS